MDNILSVDLYIVVCTQEVSVTDQQSRAVFQHMELPHGKPDTHYMHDSMVIVILYPQIVSMP